MLRLAGGAGRVLVGRGVAGRQQGEGRIDHVGRCGWDVRLMSETQTRRQAIVIDGGSDVVGGTGAALADLVALGIRNPEADVQLTVAANKAQGLRGWSLAVDLNEASQAARALERLAVTMQVVDLLVNACVPVQRRPSSTNPLRRSSRRCGQTSRARSSVPRRWVGGWLG